MTAVFCRKCKCKEVFLPSKLNPSTQLCKRCEDGDKKTEKKVNSKLVMLWASFLVVAVVLIYAVLNSDSEKIAEKADSARIVQEAEERFSQDAAGVLSEINTYKKNKDWE